MNKLMLLIFLVLVAKAISKPSLGLPLVNSGGIGGIFQGPNSETIIKGPDGSSITSAVDSGKISTKLDPIIVAEPIVKQEIVEKIPLQLIIKSTIESVENKQNSDLVGPSGRIITEGTDSVVAGPASTTIAKNGIVAETVPVLNQEITPIVSPIASAPLVNTSPISQEQIAFVSAVPTPNIINTASLLSSENSLAVTPGIVDQSSFISNETPLRISNSETDQSRLNTVPVNPLPPLVLSPRLFEPNTVIQTDILNVQENQSRNQDQLPAVPVTVTTSPVLSNHELDTRNNKITSKEIILNAPAALGLSFISNPTNQQKNLQSVTSSGALAPIIQQENQVWQSPAFELNLPPPSNVQLKNPDWQGNISPNSLLQQQGLDYVTSTPNVHLLSTPKIQQTRQDWEETVSQSTPSLLQLDSSTLLTTDGLNSQTKLNINDQLQIDNRQLLLNSAEIPSRTIISPEIIQQQTHRAVLPSRFPQLIQTAGLETYGTPNIQQKENIISLPVVSSTTSQPFTQTQFQEAFLQNTKTLGNNQLISNIQNNQEHTNVVDIRPRSQQVLPGLASIRSGSLIGSQLLQEGINSSEEHITNVPRNQIQEIRQVSIGLNDGLGLEAWG